MWWLLPVCLIHAVLCATFDVDGFFENLDKEFGNIAAIQRSVQEIMNIVDDEPEAPLESHAGPVLQPLIDAYIDHQLQLVYDLAQNISLQHAAGVLQAEAETVDGRFSFSAAEVFSNSRKTVDLEGDISQLLYPGCFDLESSVVRFPGYNCSPTTQAAGEGWEAGGGTPEGTGEEGGEGPGARRARFSSLFGGVERRLASLWRQLASSAGGAPEGQPRLPAAASLAPAPTSPLDLLLQRQTTAYDPERCTLLRDFPGLKYRVTDKMRELALEPFTYNGLSVRLSSTVGFVAADGSARQYPYAQNDTVADGRYFAEVRSTFSVDEGSVLVLVYDASRAAGRLRRDYSRKLLSETVTSISPATKCEIYALGEEALLVYRGLAGDVDFSVLAVDTLIGDFPSKAEMYRLLSVAPQTGQMAAAVFFLSGLHHASGQLEIRYLPSRAPIYIVHAGPRAMVRDIMELFVLYRRERCKRAALAGGAEACRRSLEKEMYEASQQAAASTGQTYESVRYLFQTSTAMGVDAVETVSSSIPLSKYDILSRGVLRGTHEFVRFTEYAETLASDMDACLVATRRELGARLYDMSGSLILCEEYESCELRDEIAPLMHNFLRPAPALSLKVPGSTALSRQKINYLSVPVFRQTKDIPLSELLGRSAEGGFSAWPARPRAEDFLGVVGISLQLDTLLATFSALWPATDATRNTVVLFDRAGTIYYNSDQGDWVAQETYQEAYSQDFFRQVTMALDVSGSLFYQSLQLKQRDLGVVASLANMYVAEKNVMDVLGDEQMRLSEHESCQRLVVSPYNNTRYDKLRYDVFSRMLASTPLEYDSYFAETPPYRVQSELAGDQTPLLAYYEIVDLLKDPSRTTGRRATWGEPNSGVYDDKYSPVSLEWCSSRSLAGMSVLYVSGHVFDKEHPVPAINITKLESLEQQYDMTNFYVHDWLPTCQEPKQSNYPDFWQLRKPGESELYASVGLAFAENSEEIGTLVSTLFRNLLKMDFRAFRDYVSNHACDLGLGLTQGIGDYVAGIPESGAAGGLLTGTGAVGTPGASGTPDGRAEGDWPEFVTMTVTDALELVVHTSHLVRKRVLRLLTAAVSIATWSKSSDPDDESFSNFVVSDAGGIMDTVSCRVLRQFPFRQTRAGFNTKTQPRVLYYKDPAPSPGEGDVAGVSVALQTLALQLAANSSNVDRDNPDDLVMRKLESLHCTPLVLHSELYSTNARGLHRAVAGRVSTSPAAQYKALSLVVPIYSRVGNSLYGSVELSRDAGEVLERMQALAAEAGCAAGECGLALLDKHGRVLVSPKLERDLAVPLRVSVGELEEFENRQCVVTALDDQLLNLLFYNGMLMAQADVQGGKVCSDFFIPDRPFGATVGMDDQLRDDSVLELRAPGAAAPGQAFLHRLRGTDVYALALVGAGWQASGELRAPECYSDPERHAQALSRRARALGLTPQASGETVSKPRWRESSWEVLRLLPGSGGREGMRELAREGAEPEGGRIVATRPGRGGGAVLPALAGAVGLGAALWLAAARTQGCLRRGAGRW